MADGDAPSCAAEARLQALGLTLPPAPTPVGMFRLGKVEGDLLFLSGQGPLLESGRLATGKVGRDVTAEEARHHAQRTGLVLLSVARQILGDLDRIAGVTKLLGFVNAVEEFDRHPFVIDGCSELFHQVLGDGAAHARSAIGVASLPGRISVEIEAIFSLSASGS
ncbi:MAG: RidA family protein [Rhodobacteraceae bacterium]|nr:RidA family protein [Paracoccaceae bacterium]